MLPKFRPATLGPETLARPSIRPVRPGPPPPPPSPPSPVKKISSGIGRTRGELVDGLGSVAMNDALDELDELEAPTANGLYGEPSTWNRGPETVPVETHRNPRGRANVISDVSEIAAFEEETQARPVDEHVLDKLRSPVIAADLDVQYESLPSLEVRAAYDSYERAFSEREPVTVLGGATDAARESARIRRAAPASYEDMPTPWVEPVVTEPAPVAKEPSVPAYRPPSYDSFLEPSYPATADANDQEFFPGRREESGPRSRPVPPATRSYAAPVPAYDDASDSAQWGRDKAQPHGWSDDDEAPASQATAVAPQTVAREHEDVGFVMGVQPIRGATPDAWGTPRAHGGHDEPAGSPHASAAPPPYAPSAPPYPELQAPAAPLHAPAAYPQAAYPQPQPAYAQPTYYAPQAPPYPQALYAQQQPPPPYAQPQPVYVQAPYAQAPSYPPSQAHPSYRPSPYGGALASQQLNAVAGGSLRSQLVPAQNAKAGRFAWFLAGAAFGITFAFFATGFFGASRASASSEFPPAAPLPTLTAPAAAALPPAAVAPSAGPVQAPTAPLAAAPVPPAAAPPAAAAPTASGAAAATNVNALPKAGAPAAPPQPHSAPPPPPPRSRASTRRAAPPAAPSGPRNLGGGGPGADDPPSAPSAPSGPDLGDLLGAGLKP